MAPLKYENKCLKLEIQPNKQTNGNHFKNAFNAILNQPLHVLNTSQRTVKKFWFDLNILN